MIDFLKGTVTLKDWIAVGIMIAALALVVALYIFVLRANNLQTLSVLEQQDNQVLEDLRLARQKEQNIDALREETSKIMELVDEFEQRLPERREIPMLVRQFEMLAEEVGVASDLKTIPRSRDARKETIPYDIVAYGDFHQITSFINRLERFQRYLKITNLEIGPQEAGVCEAEFTLSTYRFLQTEAGEAS